MRWKIMKLGNVIYGWIAFGSLIGAGLILLLGLALLWMRPSRTSVEVVPAILTLIPLPTATLIPPTAVIPEVTPTPDTLSPGVLGIGAYAQVVGTNGDGLRLRVGAGLDQDQRFLGLDGEVFLVIDGPREVDGYIWYYLSAPYDKARKGWAVTKFLEVVESP